jgi:hypothetical protein
VLQGKKWDFAVSAAELERHSEWKKVTFPISIHSIQDILQNGVIYAHKRDKMNRPVIIVDCQKILQRI